MTTQGRYTTEYRPNHLETVGIGLSITVVVIVVGLAILGVVSLWGSAGSGARAALLILAGGISTGAAVVGLLQGVNLADRLDSYRYNRDHRNAIILHLEGGDEVDEVPQGPQLSRPQETVVNVSGARAFLIEKAGSGATFGIGEIDQVIDAAQVVGLSRRAIMTRGISREVYDWSISILCELGLVEGRGDRAAGRLAYPTDVCKRCVRFAWGVNDGMGWDGLGTAQPVALAQGKE